MKHLTKEELVEQLKAIANDETEVTLRMGAMCYSPMDPLKKDVKCDSCGKVIYNYLLSEWISIKKNVNKIKELGYDAKVECLCHDCVKKLGIPYEKGNISYEFPNFVFYFKAKEQTDYHIVVSNVEYDYEVLTAFLNNEKVLDDTLVKNELHRIKRMTGLSID